MAPTRDGIRTAPESCVLHNLIFVTDYLLFLQDYHSGFPRLQLWGCHVLQWKIPRAQGNRRTVDHVNGVISVGVYRLRQRSNFTAVKSKKPSPLSAFEACSHRSFPHSRQTQKSIQTSAPSAGERHFACSPRPASPQLSRVPQSFAPLPTDYKKK